MLPLIKANGETLTMVEELQPFGMGNPKPTFVSYDVQVRDCRPIGTERTGVKLKLSDGVAVWDAVVFGEVAAENLSDRIDVAYTLQSNTWNGRRWVELVVKDLRPATQSE